MRIVFVLYYARHPLLKNTPLALLNGFRGRYFVYIMAIRIFYYEVISTPLGIC
jgi:hypothetical protein